MREYQIPGTSWDDGGLLATLPMVQKAAAHRLSIRLVI
jgi:hypothetical protein